MIFILIFLNLSCELESQRSRPSYYSNGKFGEFEPYVRSFDSNYYRYTGKTLPLDNLEMEFADSASSGSDRAVGECNYRTRKIKVIRKYWQSASSNERTIIIYHELGHCYLRRGHKSDKSGSMPLSIMYPTIKTNNFFQDNKQDYLEELFTGNTSQFSSLVYHQQLALKEESDDKDEETFCRH